MSTKPPIAAADIPPEWIAAVREAIQREAPPVRAHKTELVIEVKSLTTNLWMPLMLFGSGTHFTTAEDRDAVLKALTTSNG